MGALGDEEAEQLLKSGWRQGSVFSPNEHIGLPPGSPDDSLLIVLTQSCTVVSNRWKVAPLIEVATAKPLRKYNERDHAAVGRNFNKLILPVAGDGYAALEIDINLRAFAQRTFLLNFAPDGPQPDPKEARRIGGWLARCYSRVALPNKLVELLRKDCLPRIETALKGDFGGAPMHANVKSILINWEPDDEDGPYSVSVTLLAADQASTEAIDRHLVDVPKQADGLSVEITVSSIDATLISEVDGLVSLSEWDYLSGWHQDAQAHGLT